MPLSVACVASKVCQLCDCADRLTHARHASLQPEYFVLLSSSLSMLSGEIYLRLKPYLVVKISSDIVTEHCCQVCVLSMMFCRSDCVCWHGGKWLRNSLYRVVWHGRFWHSDRPTWDKKNIICIWFSHFTLTEIHRCILDSPCWQLTQRYGSHARSLIVVNLQQKLSNSSSVNCGYVVIIQYLTRCCWISHQLFSRTVTNRADSLRNHFAQLTGWAVNLSCQNPKPANSEAILFLIS